jgi:DNA invertase Pin-like site-specific DNA recombinase
MAQKITVALVDDLDGGPSYETVRFGFEGSDYEIDLSNKNPSASRQQLAPFIDHARKAGRELAHRAARTPASRQPCSETWARAREHGIAVSERLERFCAHHGYEITRPYMLSDVSAYNGARKATLDDARCGEFSLIVVWALDRITREGAEGALRIVRQFRERGCNVLSVKESWLNGSPEVRDVLAAFAGWKAQQESARRRERIKADIARRRAGAKQVGGRKQGARDKRPCKTEGYARAWERRRGAA